MTIRGSERDLDACTTTIENRHKYRPASRVPDCRFEGKQTRKSSRQAGGATGMAVVAFMFVNLYPLFHPWRVQLRITESYKMKNQQ